ncbi:MAG TPA: Crp/Fnr family transcriptional regulator [Chitinophagaceae bacterium]|nr:Crp/Fnr family transcriptional regulator [Chitinophagaceae bacterium]
MKKATCNLTRCFLCTHCTTDWKELIAIKKTSLHFKRGEALFAEGEPVKGLYFIYSGAVKVHKHWTAEKELIVRFMKTGDIVGHRGWGSGDHYPVSATALEDTVACFIPGAFLQSTLQAEHGFALQLLQFYAAELNKGELRMRNLALMEVKGRIADALLELNAVYGVNKAGYNAVTVTRQDIAAYAGTTYETVFKFMRTLIADKIISVKGKSIRILQLKKLQAFKNSP